MTPESGTTFLARRLIKEEQQGCPADLHQANPARGSKQSNILLQFYRQT